MARDEFPAPRRLPGEPSPPRHRPERGHGPETPDVVDQDLDVFGAEAAAARLADRLKEVQPGAVQRAQDGRPLLSPPFAPNHDRVDGRGGAPTTLVVFGAFGTASSLPLGRLLAHVREHHATTVDVVWRHYPDPIAHPRAAVLALAAEAAAAIGRFWGLTHELLRMRHDDPADLHAAMLRARLDPERAFEAMRAGTGDDRIVADAASALASGVTYSPALFIDGERYEGELDLGALSAALADADSAQ